MLKRGRGITHQRVFSKSMSRGRESWCRTLAVMESFLRFAVLAAILMIRESSSPWHLSRSSSSRLLQLRPSSSSRSDRSRWRCIGRRRRPSTPIWEQVSADPGGEHASWAWWHGRLRQRPWWLWRWWWGRPRQWGCTSHCPAASLSLQDGPAFLQPSVRHSPSPKWKLITKVPNASLRRCLDSIPYDNHAAFKLISTVNGNGNC